MPALYLLLLYYISYLCTIVVDYSTPSIAIKYPQPTNSKSPQPPRAISSTTQTTPAKHMCAPVYTLHSMVSNTSFYSHRTKPNWNKVYLILSHLISSYLILSHLILPCLASSPLVSSHLVSSHLVSSHLISSYLICENASPCYRGQCHLLKINFTSVMRYFHKWRIFPLDNLHHISIIVKIFAPKVQIFGLGEISTQGKYLLL